MTDEAADGVSLEGASVDASLGVDITNIDLNGGMVVGSDQALGPRAEK